MRIDAPRSAIVLGALLWIRLASAEVSLTGPIAAPGTPSIGATVFGLAPFGYEETEYFLSGTATAWVNDGDLGADGRWSVWPGAPAACTTRILRVGAGTIRSVAASSDVGR